MSEYFHLLFWPIMGGMGIMLTCAPMGCLMMWQRMAFFADALGHAGLLGAALALAFQIHLLAGIAMTTLLFSGLLLYWSKKTALSHDTLLSLLAQGLMALALILLAVLPNQSNEVLNLLYGDILSLQWQDCVGVGLIMALVAAFTWRWWDGLLLYILHPALAHAQGYPVEKLRYQYVFLLSLVVAIALKLVGALLLISCLVMPAATARLLAKTPEQMLFGGMGIGVWVVLMGMMASLFWDLPAGPSIVLVNLLLFMILLPLRRQGQ